MRSWLIAMLLLTAVLAGCSEPAPTADAGDGQDDTGDPAGDGNGTIEPGAVANNTAPVANLTADVLNGTAPLLVNLTLDGSDADGDNLTWTLAINGNQTANGTTLPTTLNFTLEAGNHTFVLTISDGNATASSNLTVEVEAADAAPPAEPSPFEDRGWYLYEVATGHCHVKTYTDVGGAHLVYRSPLSGGDWFIGETNDVDGLQIADNHPASPAGSTGGFALDLPDCEDGDQVLL